LLTQVDLYNDHETDISNIFLWLQGKNNTDLFL